MLSLAVKGLEDGNIVRLTFVGVLRQHSRHRIV